VLRHSTLLLLEAVLVLGLLEDLAQGWLLTHAGWSPFLRVGAGIALTLALLGGVSLLVQRQLVAGLRTTHAIHRRLRVPKVVFHAVVLSAIFVAYAWLWEEETGAFSACRALLPGF
jgi:hypothetical protein